MTYADSHADQPRRGVRGADRRGDPHVRLASGPARRATGRRGRGAADRHRLGRRGRGARATARGGGILGDIVDRVLRDELVGADALAREWLWHRMWELDRTEELPLYVLGLVDTALWDLAGRVAELPTWQLLGGFRRSIPAYASTVTFETLEEYLDVITQCLELGYPAIKLHAWGDARADAQLCRRVREHVGPDVALMYDGSAGFDLADAVYRGTPRRRRLPLVRGADPRVQRHRLQMAERTRTRASVRRRDLRRRALEHGGLHRQRRRIVRAHERRASRWHHRRHADRPPRRRLPASRRGTRDGQLLAAPVHGDLRTPPTTSRSSRRPM